MMALKLTVYVYVYIFQVDVKGFFSGGTWIGGGRPGRKVEVKGRVLVPVPGPTIIIRPLPARLIPGKSDPHIGAGRVRALVPFAPGGDVKQAEIGVDRLLSLLDEGIDKKRT